MKTLALFLLLATSAFAGNLADAVSAINYPLSRVMAPHRTYAGVLADAQDVSVICGPRGLIGGVTLGLANFAFGSHLGGSKVTVHQYVVRLDQPEDRQAEIITVVQGGGPLVEPGTPVFLVTEGSADGYVYSVRMIASLTPEAYGTKGLEEARLERRRMAGAAHKAK